MKGVVVVRIIVPDSHLSWIFFSQATKVSRFSVWERILSAKIVLRKQEVVVMRTRAEKHTPLSSLVLDTGTTTSPVAAMLGCWFDYAAYDGQEDSARISQQSEDRQTTNALEELTYQVAVTIFYWVWYLRKVKTGKLSHDEAAADDGHPSPNQRWRGPTGQKFSTTANVEPRGWWGSTHSGFEARQG